VFAVDVVFSAGKTVQGTAMIRARSPVGPHRGAKSVSSVEEIYTWPGGRRYRMFQKVHGREVDAAPSSGSRCANNRKTEWPFGHYRRCARCHRRSCWNYSVVGYVIEDQETGDDAVLHRRAQDGLCR